MDRFLLKNPKSSGKSPEPESEPSTSNQTPKKRRISNESDSLSDDETIQNKKKSYKQKFTDTWLKNENFSSWLVRNPRKLDEPFCILCSKSLKGGITHINRHSNSAIHKKNFKSAKETPRVTKFYNKKKEEKIAMMTKAAELKMVAFIAEHNLAFSVLDHLPQLVASMCPDSEIAKKIKCCRKKGTKLCKYVMKKEHLYVLSKTLQTVKFSLIIDESTDVSSLKSLVLIARFYDELAEKVCDKFLALLEIQDTSANGIVTSISNFFQENQIPWHNLIGFGADNASVMMGHKGGVKQKLLQFNPDIYCLGCTCHSLALCSSAACSKLPNSVEELTKDIFNYFSHSSKRNESLKEYQALTEVEPHKMLRPAQTRWLSLELVVNRILEQWSALQLFFSNEALVENIDKAKHILNALHNKIFKLYFLFLSYILDIINKINKEFQSEGFRMHILLTKIKSTYISLLRNFMKSKYINECHIDKVKFLPENYLQVENIYVGAKCEMLLLEKSVPDNEVRQFKVRCLDFYVTLCKEFNKRFQMNDPVLNFLKNLDPQVVTTSPESIIPMYVKFKSMFANIDIENLSTEWKSIASNEILLSHANKPIEEFWSMVFKMKDSLQNFMYPNLKIFIKGLFALPHSSAGAERIFSQLNIIKTKNRNKLLINTCDALMHAKSLIDNSNCYNFEPSNHLLSFNINPASTEESDVTISF